MRVGDPVSSTEDLRQGDVVNLSWVPAVENGQPGSLPTPAGVVVLSQTCDVVQASASKTHVTVAPILDAPTPNQLADSKRGRAPLLLHLPGLEGTEEAVADMQRVASVPKVLLIGKSLLGRHIRADSSIEARHLAERVGRAYSRFAFPDPVVTVLDKLKAKARKAASGSGGFGRVLDHLHLRVQADQWDHPGRTLTLFVVVRSALLINAEDADPDWSWSVARLTGLRAGEHLENADLTRLSEILADTCDTYENDPEKSDGTTLLRLWTRWSDLFKRDLLDPQTNAEVHAIHLELLSDEDMTVATWRRTATLDLEDLSAPVLATAPHLLG